MSLWDDLFDHTRGQNRDERRRERAQDSEIRESRDIAGVNRKRLAEQQVEIERLHLMVEAMTEILEARLGVSRYEIGLMIERVDLADGVLDGRRGPDRVASAPKCPNCARPVNLKRDECVYCNQRYAADDVRAALDDEKAEQKRVAKLSEVTHHCAECARVVQPTEVVFGPRGIYCVTCANKALT